jgi:hypothetical protein
MSRAARRVRTTTEENCHFCRGANAPAVKRVTLETRGFGHISRYTIVNNATGRPGLFPVAAAP